MRDDEIALRAAINVPRDSTESHRMPSGVPLLPESEKVHRWAAERLESMIGRVNRRGKICELPAWAEMALLVCSLASPFVSGSIPVPWSGLRVRGLRTCCEPPCILLG